MGYNTMALDDSVSICRTFSREKLKRWASFFAVSQMVLYGANIVETRSAIVWRTDLHKLK
jgi:hypothetical protein